VKRNSKNKMTGCMQKSLVGSFSPSNCNLVCSAIKSLGKLQEVKDRQKAPAENMVATTAEMEGSQKLDCTTEP
jgi:hypothetical protein